MKKLIVKIALLVMAAEAQAETDAISEAITEMNRAKSEWVLKQIGHEEKKQEAPLKEPKSLKHCMKPKNKIDDEVKQCMDGKIEKYW